MYLTKASDPIAPAVLMEQIMDHVRLEDDPHDLADIDQKRVAAEDYVRNTIGRCLTNQQWTLTLKAFPAEIILPLPPCQSVDNIAYLDMNGVSQALATESYQVVGLNSLTESMIVPAYGKAWPGTRGVLNAITVTFTAGFGPGWNDVPSDLREAIKQHISQQYEYREIEGPAEGGLHAFDSILDQYKVRAF